MRRYLCIGAAALALSVAGHASAAVYTLTNVQLPSSYTVHLSGMGLDKNVKMGDQLLTFEGLDPFLAYCLDPYHDAVVGNQSNQYKDDVFTSPEYGGYPISATTMQEIKGLLRLSSFADSLNRDAIQGGIWGKMGLTVTSANPTVQAAINFWTASTYQLSGSVLSLESIPNGNGIARQAYAVAPVPEPATWALMIIGFGTVGAMLRQRRQQLALAG